MQLSHPPYHKDSVLLLSLLLLTLRLLKYHTIKNQQTKQRTAAPRGGVAATGTQSFNGYLHPKKSSPFRAGSAHLHLRRAPGIQQDGFDLADVSDVSVEARAALTDKRTQGVRRPLGICQAQKILSPKTKVNAKEMRCGMMNDDWLNTNVPKSCWTPIWFKFKAATNSCFWFSSSTNVRII